MIKFNRLTTDAKIPLRATAGAAGFDVFSNFASVRNQKGAFTMSIIEFNGIRPSGSQIKEARLSCGLSQAEAAKLVHKAILTWSQYESDLWRIDLTTWELFCLKTNQSA